MGGLAAISAHAGQPQVGLIASVLTNRLMLIHTNRFVCFGQVRSSTARTLKRDRTRDWWVEKIDQVCPST
jgi:hypothetical protein